MTTTKLEKYITKQCKEYFKTMPKGFFCWKISDRYTGGMPDYYVAYESRSSFIELKGEDEEPRDLQYYQMRCLNNAGIPTFWSDDFEKVKAFIEQNILNGPTIS